MADDAAQVEILLAAHTLWIPGSVYELRILSPPKRTVNGYFNDPLKFAQVAAQWSGKAPAVYMTVNPVEPSLLARANNHCREAVTASSTSDTDIARRAWLPIDFDAIRPTGISSSDTEHQAALKRAEACRSWLLGQGCPEDAIVSADSGNGGHVLVRIDLPNDEAAKDLVQRCLQALALRFDDPIVAVDIGNFNASRIWKVYGTLVRKGDNMDDRPHRKAAILSAPDECSPVPFDFLQGIAALAPKPTAASRRSDSGVDVDAFVRRHFSNTLAFDAPWNGGHRYVLQVCPFNPDHNDRSAAVIRQASGAACFVCHHNGCSGRGWRELRELMEPRPIRAERPPEPRPASRPAIVPAKRMPVDREPTTKDLEYGLAELMSADLPPLRWGVEGIVPEGLTLVIGKAKLGKSLLVLGLCIAVASGGVALGQIKVPATGVLYLALEDGWRRLQHRSRRILGEALATNRLRLRLRWPTFDAGGLEALDEYLDAHPDVRFVAIDTLQRIRALQTGRAPFSEDYAALQGLQDLAERKHVCLIVVHHARKGEADDPLDSINGTMGLAASADGILILQRRRTEQDATLHITQRDADEPDREVALVFSSATGTWHLEGDAEEYRMKKWEEETVAVLRESAEPLRSSEIAELMDVPQGTIKVRLHRLMKEGKVRLVSRGAYAAVDEPAAVLALPRYTPYRDDDDGIAF